MKVEIYSDVACPWCYVGKKRFEQAIGEWPGREGLEVVFKPFQLDPTLSADPAQAQNSREVLTRKYGPQFAQMEARLAEVARTEGIDYQGGKVLAVNTREAHRLIGWALETAGPEAQHTLTEALFHAYFTEGRNLADAAVLADVAAQAGLDRARAAAFLATDAQKTELDSEFQLARERGITAVPTFVFEDRWVVSGAQEAATFRQVLDAVAENLKAEAGAGEACEGGSCAV
ncbi:DSBA-like thioredoxin domain protein [compost metagenome]